MTFELKLNSDMKKTLFIVLLSLISSFVLAEEKNVSVPVATFDTQEHNFGTIKEADGKVVFDFEVMNTGSAPLLLTDVTTSCGCTARQYTKEPILSGKKGSVLVTYDPTGRPGPFNKTITVKSNAGKPIILKIKGEVDPKK